VTAMKRQKPHSEEARIGEGCMRMKTSPGKIRLEAGASAG
jgi:hypothetical protein